MSDAALIQAHQAGDGSAIAELMVRHKPALMGMLTNRVGRDAEDLYQETWARVSRSIDTYDERGSFKAWLFQIARRLIIDHYRRSGAQIRLVQNPEETTPSRVDRRHPDQVLMAADVHRVFEAVVNTLDAPTAEVVRMRLRDGLSFKQIAEQQGTPINTALGRMHRALKRIRQALMDEELIDNGRQR